MTSPFPGMNPYLESRRFWSDFHHELISAIRSQIRVQLPQGFVARIEERLYILNAAIRPDVTILRRTPPPETPTGGTATAVRSVADVPIHVRAYPETVREPFIEIVAVGSSEQVVTTIELLSPANKRIGAGREEYVRKQRDLLESDTHLLEIDLLRGGTATVAVPLSNLRESAPGNTDYLVCLHRAGWGSEFDVWAVGLRERLPRVEVPLTSTFADMTLDLQMAFAQAFAAGGYGDSLPYREPAEPPLSPDDAAWAADLIRAFNEDTHV